MNIIMPVQVEGEDGAVGTHVQKGKCRLIT
jgi:hypothetical protein